MNVILNTKDLIKLREFRNKGIQSLWCETQQEDVQNIIDLMEAVASAATQVTYNTMSLDLLKQAKIEFIETLMEISERYRCVSPK